MRSCFCSRPDWSIAAACLVATCLVASGAVADAANKPEVIAVVAADGYADLREQLTWVGEQVGNPTLAGFAESFILLATQGKGLAGLDVKRPIGVVITSSGGPLPTAHAFLPVKDLDKLLGAVQGMIGPVEEVDGVRRIAAPGAPPLEIVEKDGWAIFSQPGDPVGIDDPLTVIEPLTREYSLAVELFPSRMPAEMRDRLKALLDEAARNAAAQGQAMDPAQLQAGLERLEDVETIVFGFAVDKLGDKMMLDMTSVLTPAAVKAAGWINAGWGNANRAVSTVGAPATTDGKAAAVRGHYAATVPAEGQAAVRAALDQALEPADDDPANRVVTNLLRDLVAAMLDSGAIDAGLTIDTSAADATQPLPAVTLGMKVKDGAALEKKVKERLGKADALPPSVKVTFDAGKQGNATLHEITVDVSALPAADRLGDSVKLTLAVTPQYAYVLVGGDVPKRLAAALAAGGKPNGDALPITNVDLSLASLVGYAARMMQAFNPDDPQGDLLGEIAKQAGEKDTTTVQFSVKPVDRGIALRLSADAGALQTVAASTAMQQAAPPPRARPLTPLRPAQPRQLENDDTPSIAP
jgi:hypothetical protein